MPTIRDLVLSSITKTLNASDRFRGSFDDEKNAYVINKVKLTGAAFATTDIQIKVSEINGNAAIKLCMYCPVSARDNKETMCDFLTYVNYGMLLGTFEIKPMFISRGSRSIPGGTVRYRRTITISEDPDVAGKMLERSLEIGCDIIVAFSGVFKKIASTSKYQFLDTLYDLEDLKEKPAFEKISFCFDDDI